MSKHEEQFKQMEIGATLKLNSNVDMVRVPGGWVYERSVPDETAIQVTFVPLPSDD